MSKGEAEVLTNLESIGDLIGGLAGISQGLEEDEYTESLIKQAHGKATNVFDVAAASAGAAGAIPHVFEFGTAGVTPGQVRFPDPTSPEARLWQHQIVGHGGQQDIRYTFRPAVNRNPKPTTRSTGVPSKYLRRLSQRKYVFWNKAFVMETGQTVEIKSNRGERGLLFVPTPGMNAPRNFIMYPSKTAGPIRSVPGQSVQGNFTQFWLSWWAGIGSELIENDMRKSVMEDTELAMAETAKVANRAGMKPAAATNIPGAISRTASVVKKIFKTRRIR